MATLESFYFFACPDGPVKSYSFPLDEALVFDLLIDGKVDAVLYDQTALFKLRLPREHFYLLCLEVIQDLWVGERNVAFR